MSSLQTEISRLPFNETLTTQQTAQWARVLGVTNAPFVDRDIRTAVRFLFLHRNAFEMDLVKAYSYVKAIDLHRTKNFNDPSAVEVTLKQDTGLIAFRNADLKTRKPYNPFGHFYSLSGASPFELGIHDHGRVPVRYRVIAPVADALRCYTTPFVDVHAQTTEQDKQVTVPWRVMTSRHLAPAERHERGVMAHGEQIQFIIPNAKIVLRVDDSNNETK